MRFEYEDMSLWYGTADAPAPEGTIGTSVELTITVGVQPWNAGNHVEVLYRINQGPIEGITARWLRNDSHKQSQYFRASFPTLRVGDVVEYIALCRRAGRQVVPAPARTASFSSSFSIRGIGARQEPGKLPEPLAMARSPQDVMRPNLLPIGGGNLATGDFTGVWVADNGASYYIRQIGNTDIWWVGMNGARDGITSYSDFSRLVNCFHPGTDFTNVFRGRITTTGIEGAWADVPRGRSLLNGTLMLGSIIQVPEPADNEHPPIGVGHGPPPRPSIELFKRSETEGPFGSSRWRRATNVSLPLDIASRFEFTKRNDWDRNGNNLNMHSHLKMYKDNVVVIGEVVRAPFRINFPPMVHPNTNTDPNVPQDYCSFIAAPWWNRLDGATSIAFYGTIYNDPPDGDIDFDVRIDRAGLESVPNFWSEGWLQDNPPNILLQASLTNILSKLDEPRDKDDPNADKRNWIHPELIMYGRDKDDVHCGDKDYATWLPGWKESGGDSVLLNGRPIEGQIDFGPPFKLLNREISLHSQVRVTGFLALDCHGAGGDCAELNPLDHNVELHPVYALDILQDFTQPRFPFPFFPTLTGVWHANDMGTYYIRQIGDTDIWWLGLSSDQGQTYANVFQGTMQSNAITGQWVDVPVGVNGSMSSGTLTLCLCDACHVGASSIELTVTSQTGGFGPRHWRKLYDIFDRQDIISTSGGHPTA